MNLSFRFSLVRTTALLLAVLLLVGCTAAEPSAETTDESASSAVEEETVVQSDSFSVAYNPDTFNPYCADSILVEQVAGLLFEKLVEISPTMELDYRLAQSIQSSGLTVTLQIRGDCYFANGSPITAEDAAASLEAARQSSLYSARLSNIDKIEIQGSAVILTLKHPDSLFAYLLDLPVLRSDETLSSHPTASGRYTYGAENDCLIRNLRSAFSEASPDTIRLSEANNYESLISSFALGQISFYIAQNGSSGTIASLESYYRTNTLLFVGVNASAKSPFCSTNEGRRLLSELLSRKELAVRCSNTGVAGGALNSFYPCVKGHQVILTEDSSDRLEETMTQLGYTRNPDTDFYQTAEGERATLSLLVCTANSDKRYLATLLQQQWENAGFEIRITEEPDYTTYLQQLQNKQFDLYIGEVKLYNNMDLTPFWSGHAGYGLIPSQALLTAYQAFRSNAGSAGDFEAMFAEEMPYIPLLWRNGVTVSSRKASGVVSTVSNPYYSLAQLNIP